MPTTVDGSTGISQVQDNTVTAAKLGAAAVTPPKMSGGQSGSAPNYGARAWASLTSTGAANPTLNASGNIASVTRTGTGQWAVTFTTPMQDANYAVSVTHGQLGFGIMASNTTASGFTIGAFNPATAAYADIANSIPVSIAVVR